MFRPSRILMNGAGTDAPSGAQPAPVAPPAVVAATPPAPAADDQNPPWLKGRIEQAKASALAELGITDPAKAKTALDAAKKAEDEAKSAAERLGETSKTLAAEKARADAYEVVIKERASSELGALTAEQQEAVRKIAPDTNPAAQLSAITALAPTWKAAAPAPPVAPPVPAKPPAAPPANTSPPADAPPAAAGSPPDHKAEYARLKTKNPVAAAAYMNEHADKIYPPA